MSHDTILIIVVIIAFVALAFTMNFHPVGENYCNCTGMATAFNRAPYIFWQGAGWRGNEFPRPYEADPNFSWCRGGLSQHCNQWPKFAEMPFVQNSNCSSGSKMRLDEAYGINSDVLRDLNRDKIDGLLDPISTSPPLSATGGGCGNEFANFVPLPILHASVPPGSVSENRLRFGDGKYLESAPMGNERYGGFKYIFPPKPVDMSVGVL